MSRLNSLGNHQTGSQRSTDHAPYRDQTPMRGPSSADRTQAMALLNGCSDIALAEELWAFVDSDPLSVIEILATGISTNDSPGVVPPRPPSGVPTGVAQPGDTLPLPPMPNMPDVSAFTEIHGVLPSEPHNQPFFAVQAPTNAEDKCLYDIETLQGIVRELRSEAESRASKADLWHPGSAFQVAVNAREDYDKQSTGGRVLMGAASIALLEVPTAVIGHTFMRGVRERQIRRADNSAWRAFMAQEILNTIRFDGKDTPRLDAFNRAYEKACRKQHIPPLPEKVRLAALIPLLAQHEKDNKATRRERRYDHKKFKEHHAERDFVKMLIDSHATLGGQVHQAERAERLALYDLMARYASQPGKRIPSTTVNLTPSDDEPAHPDCWVCFEPIKDLVPGAQPRSCDHPMCTDCLKQSIETSAKDSTVPVCMMQGCNRPFSAADAERLRRSGLSQADLDDLRIKVFQRTLAEDDAWLLCWKCGVDGTPKNEIPAKIQDWNCGHCCASTCKSCGQAGHGGGECSGSSGPHIYTKAELKALPREERKRIEAIRKAERKTEKKIEKQRKAGKTQDCPSCGTACQRLGGCNDMICGSCNEHFTWIGDWKQ